MKLTIDQLNAIYTILVSGCGAPESGRQMFVHHYISHTGEWRFCGHLGYGGKFRNYGAPLYVDCYPEDLTPERREIIRTANEQLVRFGAEAL